MGIHSTWVFTNLWEAFQSKVSTYSQSPFLNIPNSEERQILSNYSGGLFCSLSLGAWTEKDLMSLWNPRKVPPSLYWLYEETKIFFMDCFTVKLKLGTNLREYFYGSHRTNCMRRIMMSILFKLYSYSWSFLKVSWITVLFIANGRYVSKLDCLRNCLGFPSDNKVALESWKQ